MLASPTCLGIVVHAIDHVERFGPQIDRCSRSEPDVLHERDVERRKPGPVSVLRPLLPNVPNAGIENAAVLNHVGSPGWHRRLAGDVGPIVVPEARFDRPVLLLSMSGSSATVNGRPD